MEEEEGGSMNPLLKPLYQEIFEKAKPFLRTRKNLIHTRMALRYALKLLQSGKGEEDIVIPAVLLHDVGWKALPKDLHLNAFGPNPSNPELVKVHEREGATIARRLLRELHYPSKKIEEICKIIQGHDSRKKPLSMSDRIVKEADKLWRYSKKGVAIDTERFRISPEVYLAYLEGKIDQWFLTPEAKRMARKEIFERRRFLP